MPSSLTSRRSGSKRSWIPEISTVTLSPTCKGSECRILATSSAEGCVGGVLSGGGDPQAVSTATKATGQRTHRDRRISIRNSLIIKAVTRQPSILRFDFNAGRFAGLRNLDHALFLITMRLIFVITTVVVVVLVLGHVDIVEHDANEVAPDL